MFEFPSMHLLNLDMQVLQMMREKCHVHIVQFIKIKEVQVCICIFIHSLLNPEGHCACWCKIMSKTYKIFFSSSNLLTCLATRQMIQACFVARGLDYLRLTWANPKFLPESYQLKYMCVMTVPSMFKNVTENFVLDKTKNLSSVTTSIKISGLLPNSTCTLMLLAVYNPAGIDSGIALTGATLHDHANKRNSG